MGIAKLYQQIAVGRSQSQIDVFAVLGAKTLKNIVRSRGVFPCGGAHGQIRFRAARAVRHGAG